jgi:WXG100 family type VII secretion target
MSGPYSGLELSDLKQIMSTADPTGIRNTASGFKSVSSSLDQVITTLQNSQTQLKSSWQGDAADAANQTFDNVITQAQQTKQVSDAMAEHLPTLANQVESAQKQVSQIPEPQKPSGFFSDVESFFGDDGGYSAAKQAAANKALGVINETDTKYQQSTSFMNDLSGSSGSESFTPSSGGSASANGAFDLGGSDGAMTGYAGYGSGYDAGGADGYDGTSEEATDSYQTGLTSAHGDGIYGGVAGTPPTLGGGSKLAGAPSGPVTIAEPGPITNPFQPGPHGNNWSGPVPTPTPETNFIKPVDPPSGGGTARSVGGGENEESGYGMGNEDGILGSPNVKNPRVGGNAGNESESGAFGEETSGAGPGGVAGTEAASSRPMGMSGMNGLGASEGRGDRAGYLSEDEDYWTGGLPRSGAGDDGIFGGMPVSMTPTQQRNSTVRSVYSSEEADAWAGGRAGNPVGAAGAADSEGAPMMGMGSVANSSSQKERKERPGYLRQDREYWEPQQANPAVVDH